MSSYALPGAFQPILLTRSTPNCDLILNGIVQLHAHCILHDGIMATYLPPLSWPKLLSYWHERLDHVFKGLRHIIVSLLSLSSRSAKVPDPVFAADGSEPVPAPLITLNGEVYEVAGVVVLHKPISETGPFRGEVEKLFTSPNHRRKGVARSMMRELERVARRDGRWSLLLCTPVGSKAEGMYPKLGYIRMGIVKAYGISPVDGRLVDEVWFWKDLRETPEI